MKKKNKNLEKKNPVVDQATYSIWGQYNNFIRQLYLEKSLKKPTGKQLTLKYLSKLAIVFIGAFFTTLTFYFLIDPNGIYNSGLNGLIQAFSKLIVGHTKIGWGTYYLIYYGLGLAANLVFILFLRFFFQAKLEIISTSIFYVISQIIWTWIFGLLSLREYVFSRLNPGSWQGLSSSSQLSFTLPYYIVIAIVAAIIHTYGYSLIFQAQATPGGLEIFTSHFSTSQEKKSKFSISSFMKIFGIIIILAVTLVNFTWIEDSPKMKESALEKEVIEALEKEESKEKVKKKVAEIKAEGIQNTVAEWKRDIIKVKQLSQEKGKKTESIEIREKNALLTAVFKNKVGEASLENYPQEVDYYLVNDKEKIAKMTAEITEIDQARENLPEADLEEKLSRKNDLENRKRKLEAEQKRWFVGKYFSYVTNNERLWATLVYIFLSSFLISQIFPRDQIVSLSLHSLTEEEQKKGLKLLAKYSPTYYTIYRKKDEKEEVVYVTSCYLSKWSYYLLTPYLKQIGKTYINEAN